MARFCVEQQNSSCQYETGCDNLLFSHENCMMYECKFTVPYTMGLTTMAGFCVVQQNSARQYETDCDNLQAMLTMQCIPHKKLHVAWGCSSSHCQLTVTQNAFLKRGEDHITLGHTAAVPAN